VKQVAFKMPPIPGIDGAIYNVLEHNAKHGTEMYIALRPDGSTQSFGYGNDMNVRVNREARGCFLVHNHPGDACPLSIDDFKVITTQRLYGNLCCSSDGSVAWSCGPLTRNPWVSEFLIDKFGLTEHTHRLGSAVAQKYGDRGMTAASWMILQNLINSDVLINLFVKNGTDFSGYDLAVNQGVRLLPTFGFVAE